MRRIGKGYRRYLPTVDLTRLTITQQRDAVQRGDCTARELVAAHLERCETLNHLLNAFTLIDADQALLRAEMLDRRGTAPGPLPGIPIGVKDLFDQRGLPNTAGSSFYRTHPKRTATAVRRLEEAGAIMLGRTVLHEFAFGFSSENPWTGPARNPWDTDLSPGGSSGGSAAAVAARMVPGALGTDTGGSVRVPAALCGVVGLKVTFGRIPTEGVVALAPSLDTVGPLTRTVADAVLLYGAMAGFSASDPTTPDRPVELPEGPDDLAGLRMAVPHPWVDRPMEAGLRSSFESFLEYLQESGAQVTEIDEPLLDPSEMIIYSSYPEIALEHASWFPARHQEYGPDVRDRLRQAMSLTVAQGTEGQRWRRRLRSRMNDLFDEIDILVTPTVAASRKEIGVDEIEIDGENLFYRGPLSAFTSLVNQAGNPALALPLIGDRTPPASVQLIGPHWGERGLLAIGLRTEDDGIAGYESPPL